MGRGAALRCRPVSMASEMADPGMTGKLDEISQAIGGLQATTDGLAKQLDVHCDDDRRRHEDNLQSLREITEQIRDVNESVRALQPLAETVALMKPIVAG